MKKHFRWWGAAYILFALFAGSWIGQYFTMDAETPGPLSGPEFWAATFENWQSEWLQLFVQAVLLLGLGHYVFKADKEDMERLEAKVDRLLERE